MSRKITPLRLVLNDMVLLVSGGLILAFPVPAVYYGLLVITFAATAIGTSALMALGSCAPRRIFWISLLGGGVGWVIYSEVHGAGTRFSELFPETLLSYSIFTLAGATILGGMARCSPFFRRIFNRLGRIKSVHGRLGDDVPFLVHDKQTGILSG